MRVRLAGLLAWLAVELLSALPAPAQTKRIFPVPPMQWDSQMTQGRPALNFSPSDLGNLTGGITFGISPYELNAKLPVQAPGVEWGDLPFATEYPTDVRYFWARLDAMRDLKSGINGCFGASSYVVFLFTNHQLFRVSWRLLPDADCASTVAAAEDIYGRFLAIDRTVSVAAHYRAGNAEVVEITDPGTDYLQPYRWENRQARKKR
jgi:hypothetical protein